MSTLCPEHYAPVLNDGGPEPCIFAIWPISPCAICGKWPPHEAIGRENWVAVSDAVVERAKRAPSGRGE